MAGSILRNWFVPKDGINRQVISADIQKYLGNDATVRPGKDKGYWIKAYRNLTSVRLSVGLHFNPATNTGPPNGNGAYRASTNSPQLDGAYLPPNGHVPPHVAQRIPIPDMASSPYEDPRSRMYGLPPHSGAPSSIMALPDMPMMFRHPT
ncbi:unnamed protein product [Aureobasidium pullulans]|nr:unnamed protein product [Aureobasidium pullulans]